MTDPRTEEVADSIEQQAQSPADSTLPADVIRNSPEYRELQRQNRLLARQQGAANAELARVRSDAERERAAAEAQRQAMMEQEVRSILGEEGVAAWAEIADLSATDQVAAARKFRELMAMASAQSAPPAQPPAPEAPPTPPEGPVATQPIQTPPPMRVDASAPLGQASNPDEYLTIAADLEKVYAEKVALMQNPMTRNRVGMRGVAEGLISYLGAAYLKAGARPKQ